MPILQKFILSLNRYANKILFYSIVNLMFKNLPRIWSQFKAYLQSNFLIKLICSVYNEHKYRETDEDDNWGII